jgi:hypothetical protein
MGRQVFNLFSYNFKGLVSNETIKVCAIETLHKYGVGGCSCLGFLLVHLCFKCTFAMMDDFECLSCIQTNRRYNTSTHVPTPSPTQVDLFGKEASVLCSLIFHSHFATSINELAF